MLGIVYLPGEVYPERPLIRPTCHRIKANDAERLEDEYRKLVEGLQGGAGGGADGDEDESAARNAIEDEDFMANPGALPFCFRFLVVEIR